MLSVEDLSISFGGLTALGALSFEVAEVAVLLVEQNARRALRLAARAYVLETGRVAVAGASAALADDPRVRLAYLGFGRNAAPR